MKVAVINSLVPFGRGGVEAELVRIPFTWEPSELLIDAIVLSSGIRLGAVDRVIGLRFPAYLVEHPHKRLWLLHQYRQAYDLWDAGQSNIPNNPRGEAIRHAVMQADNACFAACQRIFTNQIGRASCRER